MDKVSSSQCSSSGCDTGWTFYLDQSSYSKSRRSRALTEKEEDLSMVSDASSGPPHYFLDDDDCVEQVVASNPKTAQRHVAAQPISFLDDTASSPGFTNLVLDPSATKVVGISKEYTSKPAKPSERSSKASSRAKGKKRI